MGGFAAQQAWGQANTFSWNAGSANWNTGADWTLISGPGGETYPGQSQAGDIATISSGTANAFVTLNVAVQPLGGLTIGATSELRIAGQALVINGPVNLASTNATAVVSQTTATGSITFNGAVTLSANTIFRQRTVAGTFTVNVNAAMDGAYSLTLNSTAANRIVALDATADIGSGTPITSLTLTYGSINMNGNSLHVTGNISRTSPGALSSTGTIYLQGTTGQQTIDFTGSTIQNLVVNNTFVTAPQILMSNTAAFTWNGNLSFTQGTLQLANLTQTVGGNVSGTGTLDASFVIGANSVTVSGNVGTAGTPLSHLSTPTAPTTGAQLLVGGNWNVTSLTPGTGTIVMTGSGRTMTPNGQSFNNLTIANTASTTLSGNLSVGGNLSIGTSASATSLDTAGYNITPITGTFNNYGTLYRQGGDTVAQTDTAKGTTYYRTSGSTIQDYGATDYYDLTVNGAFTWTDASPLTVAGALTTLNSAAVSITGALVVSGASSLVTNVTTTLTQGYTGGVTLTGAANLTGSTVTFSSTVGGAYDLTVTGAAVFDGAVSTPTSISVTGGSTINTTTMTTSGAQTYTGGVTLANDVAFTGASGSLVWFKNTVVGSVSARALSVKTANAEFDGTVGGSNLIASVSVDGTTLVNAGAITTTGAGGQRTPVP